MHQKVSDETTSVESNMPEHVISDLMEHMQKFEEEVRIEKDKLLKIMADFYTIVCASHFMEK